MCCGDLQRFLGCAESSAFTRWPRALCRCPSETPNFLFKNSALFCTIPGPWSAGSWCLTHLPRQHEELCQACLCQALPWQPQPGLLCCQILIFWSRTTWPDRKMKLFGAACAVPHLSPHDLPLNTAFPGPSATRGCPSVVLLRAVVTRS